MRLIDADKLKADMTEKVFCGDGTYKIFGVSMEQIKNAPTITPPPNAPLTLEELREMDGEPVYLAIDHKWYVVNLNYWGPGGNRELCGVDMWGNGTSLSLLAECGLYRRKPEEGTI